MRRYDSNDLGGINAKQPCGKGRESDLRDYAGVKSHYLAGKEFCAVDVERRGQERRRMNFGTWLLKILSQFVKDWIDAGEWRPRYE